jgi:outer membrane protein assembly factor BamA
MRYQWKILVFFVLFSTTSVFSFGQSKVILKIYTSETLPKKIAKELKSRRFDTNEEARNQLLDKLQLLKNQGYLSASIDSVYSDSVTVSAFMNLGNNYKFVINGIHNIDSSKNIETGLRNSYVVNRDLESKEFYEICDNILRFQENNGYPFAGLQLQHFQFDEGKIYTDIEINCFNKIVIDSLLIKGSSRLSKSYLTKYLNIKPGQLYDESKIRRISDRLKELPFVSYVRPFDVLFSDEKTKIILYLDKKRASQFYGMIGVLPNSSTTGKLMINGELKLMLHNSFGHGELIDLNWRSLTKGSQDIKLNLAYPYLFGTPFGVSYAFSMLKKDSTFLTLNHDIGIQYFFSGQNYFKVVLNLNKSGLIRTKGLEALTVLPAYADLSANLYGLAFNFERYDYKLNPTRGIKINIFSAIGTKTIRKNDAINPMLYDSLDLKTTQFKAELATEGYIPLFKKSTLLLRGQYGMLMNNSIYENEMFRLGGLHSLRGFDDESILASTYAMFLVEARYLFEKNSFFALFFNAAGYEKNVAKNYENDFPYGFGAGLSFDTKLGNFSFYYALGSQFSQPVSFKQGKIHFGITNHF